MAANLAKREKKQTQRLNRELKRLHTDLSKMGGGGNLSDDQRAAVSAAVDAVMKAQIANANSHDKQAKADALDTVSTSIREILRVVNVNPASDQYNRFISALEKTSALRVTVGTVSPEVNKKRALIDRVINGVVVANLKSALNSPELVQLATTQIETALNRIPSSKIDPNSIADIALNATKAFNAEIGRGSVTKESIVRAAATAAITAAKPAIPVAAGAAKAVISDTVQAINQIRQKKPVVTQPAAQPTTERPAAKQTTVRPAAAKPATVRPAAAKPTTVRPAVQSSGTLKNYAQRGIKPEGAAVRQPTVRAQSPASPRGTAPGKTAAQRSAAANVAKISVKLPSTDTRPQLKQVGPKRPTVQASPSPYVKQQANPKPTVQRPDPFSNPPQQIKPASQTPRGWPNDAQRRVEESRRQNKQGTVRTAPANPPKPPDRSIRPVSSPPKLPSRGPGKP